MSQLLAIAIGGSIGALLRFWGSNGVYALLGRDFPYGTLLINVFGSLIMGLLFVLLVERSGSAPEWRALLMVGLLGSFTTFSTFSMETLALLEDGEIVKALLNIFLSVILCLLAVWGGVVLGRQI